MVVGIYCYKDSQNDDKVVYVGKDSHIDSDSRYYAHFNPSRYNDQPFNRVLQNNPERYSYHILKMGDFDENLLNALEIIYIKRYSPKFNFTVGGDGSTGYTHSVKSKKKISNSKRGTHYSLDARINMSKANNTTGYFNVSKRKNKKYLNGFTWCYSYNEDGKRKFMMSVDLNELERKVRLKGLTWIKFE